MTEDLRQKDPPKKTKGRGKMRNGFFDYGSGSLRIFPPPDGH